MVQITTSHKTKCSRSVHLAWMWTVHRCKRRAPLLLWSSSKCQSQQTSVASTIKLHQKAHFQTIKTATNILYRGSIQTHCLTLRALYHTRRRSPITERSLSSTSRTIRASFWNSMKIRKKRSKSPTSQKSFHHPWLTSGLHSRPWPVKHRRTWHAQRSRFK